MTGVESSLFIDHRGTIWGCGGWGCNFSKFINRGSHRGVSQRGIWTGFIQGTTRVHIHNNVQYSNNNILK